MRRVVLTSSIRAVFGFGCEKPPGYLYSEDDWNTTSTLANNQAYALSKTLAEVRAWMKLPRPCVGRGRASHVVTYDVPAPPSQQAAWEYARNQSQYTLVAVNPGKPPLDDERAVHKGIWLMCIFLPLAPSPGMVFGPTLSSNDDGMSTELFRALMTGGSAIYELEGSHAMLI